MTCKSRYYWPQPVWPRGNLIPSHLDVIEHWSWGQSYDMMSLWSTPGWCFCFYVGTLISRGAAWWLAGYLEKMINNTHHIDFWLLFLFLEYALRAEGENGLMFAVLTFSQDVESHSIKPKLECWMLWKPSDDACLCLIGIISGGVLMDGEDDEDTVTMETGARFKDLRGKVGDLRGLKGEPRCVRGPWNIYRLSLQCATEILSTDNSRFMS